MHMPRLHNQKMPFGSHFASEGGSGRAKSKTEVDRKPLIGLKAFIRRMEKYLRAGAPLLF